VRSSISYNLPVAVAVVAAACAVAAPSARAQTPPEAPVVPPRPIAGAGPAWPPDVAPAPEVVVPVTLVVRKDGSADDVKADAAADPRLAAAAEQAVRGWRFEPARRGPEIVEARVRVAVRFPPPAAAAPVESPAAAAPELSAYVRGQRPPRSASEVARDRAILAAAPHRSADELLYVIPGVFITQHSGEGKAYQIFYRGFDAVHGQDLEIWAGGVPVNDVSNIHGQGYADLHFIPTEVVKQVIATPGTFDPRQGDFAVAGSLRFELGYDEPGVTARAEAGSSGARRAFLAYRPEGLSDGTFAAAEVYETHGFGPSRAAQRASAIGQLLLPVGADTTLRLLASAYTGHFSSAGVVRLDDVEAGRIDRFASYDATQGGASSRTQLAVELRHQDDREQWHLASYLVLRSLRLRDNFTGYLTDANGDSQQQVHDDLMLGASGAYGRRLRLLSDDDSLEAGFFFRSDWIDQSQRRVAVVDNRVTADLVDARVKAHDVAGYLDVGLHPLRWLTLRGGARVDGLGYYAEDNGARAAGQARASQGTHLGLKGTLDLRLRAGLHLLASGGTGFRSPQARSLAEGETTPFTRVSSYELGVRAAGALARGSLAAFQTQLSDDLVFDQAAARNERVPATRRRGVTAEVASTPRPWLTGALAATYTRAQFRGSDTRYQAGDLVPYAPQWVLRSDLAFTPGLGRVRGLEARARLGAGASWLARRPLPYGQWGHDLFLLDGSAALRLGPAELGLAVLNLLDAGWYDGEFVYASRWDPGQAAALVPQRHVTVGAPRSFLVSLALFH
jgi:iron complex outermembrane recepter protein